MDYKEKLKELGLTDKESLFYLKGLELGEFTISSIAHETGIKRPTCYLIIDEMLKNNLITLLPRGRKNLYRATSPEILLENINKKLGLAQIIVPHLLNIQEKEKTTPKIQFYRGRHGIETIYNDILKSKPGSILYSMSSTEQIVKMVGREFFDSWVQKRTSRKIKSLIIMPEKDYNPKGFLQTDAGAIREYRYLPKPFAIDTTVGVYENKVAFFSSDKDNFSFIVTSNEFAKTMKDIFNFLWQIA